MDVRVNLSWQDSHDRVGLHVEVDSGTRLEELWVDFRAATNDIAGSASSLNDNLFITDFLEDVADWVSNALQVLDVVLSAINGLLLLFPLVLLLEEGLFLLGKILLNLDVVLDELRSVCHLFDF